MTSAMQMLIRDMVETGRKPDTEDGRTWLNKDVALALQSQAAHIAELEKKLEQSRERSSVDYDAAHLMKGGLEIRIEFSGRSEAGRFFAELQSRSFAAIHTIGDDT